MIAWIPGSDEQLAPNPTQIDTDRHSRHNTTHYYSSSLEGRQVSGLGREPATAPAMVGTLPSSISSARCACNDCAALPTNVARAILQTQPKTGKGVVRALFRYARALKSMPDLGDNLKMYADCWYHSLLYRDDWILEQNRRMLLSTMKKVKAGVDKDSTQVAYEKAQLRPYPECTGDMSHRLRVLASVCRELQIMSGNDPFWISCRNVGKMFSVHHSSGSDYLHILEEALILQVVKTGRLKGRKATTYFYLPDPME